MTPMRRVAGVATGLWIALAALPAGAVDIARVISPGGIEAWLVHDTLAPVISISFAFAAGGAADDPPGKEGLSDMVTGLLDEGAGPLDSQAFQRALEDNAIRLSFSSDHDRFSGSLRTLSANREEAFRLLRLALTEPHFDAESTARIRAQLVAAQKSRSERPATIARALWFKTVFPSHPYGRPPEGSEDSLKAITADDLRQFVGNWLVRDGLRIGVVGDIDAAELGKRLDEMFGALPGAGARSRVAEIEPQGAGRVIVVERPIPQSVVTFGQLGVKRDDPDYYAAFVLNHILGGSGFSARLMEQVREKRGLAYSVYSYLSPFSHVGLIMGGVATRNADVAESLELIREEWRKIADNGVTTAELAGAKTNINGAFPLRFVSTSSIAAMLVEIQIGKLGIDYLDRRIALIDAVSVDDVKRVARRLLDPERLTVVVVGSPQGVTPHP